MAKRWKKEDLTYLKRYAKTKRLEELTVVEAPPDDRERVFFGAWVTLEDQDGESRRYRVVGPDEIAPDRGWISIQSPLGRVMLGKRAGDLIEVMRPAGPASYTILEISYEP